MSDKAVSIAFTGDLSFTKYFSDTSEKVIDKTVADFLAQSDYCVGNIEGPVMSSEYANGKEFSHFTDSLKAAMLSEMNIKIWSLANNHILDFGDDGVCETLKYAEENGCRVVGAGRSAENASAPIIIEEGGGVGIISVTYTSAAPKNGGKCRCLNWNDTAGIKKAIAEIKSACRWCVLVVHGGDEFSDMPMPYTREKYLGFLDMGFDIIVGHHPHIVQNYETVNGKLIFYSLGNFIFDTDYQRAQVHTDTGVLVRIVFSEDSFSWRSQGIIIDRKSRTIRAAAPPAIFSEVSEKEYLGLWKKAARGLVHAERKVLTYLKPSKYKKYNGLLWGIREIYACRRKRDRVLLKGKLLSCFSRSGADNPELEKYLKK